MPASTKTFSIRNPGARLTVLSISDAPAGIHDPGQSLGSLHHRDPPAVRLLYLHVVRRDGGGYDHHVGTVDVVGLVAYLVGYPGLFQKADIARGFEIGAGDPVAAVV